MFQVVKGCLYFSGPVLVVVFLGEVKEDMGDGGVVWSEVIVEVGKVEEGLYIFDFSRGGSAGDFIKFYWIHGELS